MLWQVVPIVRQAGFLYVKGPLYDRDASDARQIPRLHTLRGGREEGGGATRFLNAMSFRDGPKPLAFWSREQQMRGEVNERCC